MSGGPVVSAIIPTLNGEATLPALLAALERQRGRTALEIVAIDSGSRDGTLGLLSKAGATVLDLGGRRFGHGSSRNRAAAQARGEVLVLLTQDVEPVDDDWLAVLVHALAEDGVAGAFGRQIPRGARPEEAYLAEVNYPSEPRTVTAGDLDRPFGPGRTFFSSAFGAMRREVWERIPIPDIVMSEDQAWAIEALRAGHRIRYAPEAAAYHGHRFSLRRAFRRNFDSGSSLAQLGVAGGQWAAGALHLGRELRWVAARHGPVSAARAMLYEAVRMAAFQMGRLERYLPAPYGRLLGEAPRG
jgi:rhamnosyltransferase